MKDFYLASQFVSELQLFGYMMDCDVKIGKTGYSAYSPSFYE